ncbi:enediyne antibiotic chromoprotein [Streptosporangium sp. KLBMP 9127]|nr:hypothetical protein [Streptosporangium sp. KLBMP 9127]MCG5217537.1 hypothetical protein [Streptosporangium sp. KLBMP 9127]
MQKTSRFAKFGVAAAVVVGGLTLASQPAAFAAAAPSFSVTPASGLSDGSSVTVGISGAGAGEHFVIVQCATVGGQLACNDKTPKDVGTDASGSASTSFVVNKTFSGATPEGTPVGTVDCAATACFVSAGNETTFLGSKAISFS